MSTVSAGSRDRASAASVRPAEEGHSPMPDMERYAAEPGQETAAPHPEEMKATVDLRLGKSVSIRMTARATPAGLVAAAMLVSALVIPMVWLARAQTRDRIRAS